MKQTWINYIQHVTIFISHIVTILVYVHTHIYLLWCVCPASNGNHQIFVVVDPYCTFPTPLRDTTHLWTIGGCTGCVSLRVSVLEEDRVFGFSPRDYWCQGDLKHMLYDCHVSNIANSSGIFSVDEVWRSIRIIQLLTWSDLRYNKFVGSNQRGGSNDDCYILFCNCQLGSPLILSAAKDEKCRTKERVSFRKLWGPWPTAFALSFRGCTCVSYSLCYTRGTSTCEDIYIFARTRIYVHTQCHSDPMV